VLYRYEWMLRAIRSIGGVEGYLFSDDDLHRAGGAFSVVRPFL
jgi:hypothetical protein